MNQGSREFRDRYKADLPQRREMNYSNNRTGQNNRNTNSERLTAPRGTAHKAKQMAKKRKRKIRLRIASLLLAAGVGVGALTVTGNTNRQPQLTVTQTQEMGIDATKMGLETDTAELMEKYDEFFKDFDSETASISEQEVISMINDIDSLNNNVIRDKIADLLDVERKDVKIPEYRFEKRRWKLFYICKNQ